MKNWVEIIQEQVEGQVNLRTLYFKLNKEYFGGALRSDFTFKWNNSTRIAGVVKSQVQWTKKVSGRLAQFYPSEGVVTKWKSLEISKKFNMSEDELKGIMVHEMIHVWLLDQGIIETSGGNKMHGTEFMNKLHQLQARTPFNIPETETNLKFSKQIKARPTGYLWVKFKTNKNWIVKAGVDWVEQHRLSLSDRLLSIFNRVPGVESVELGVANTGEIQTVKGIRKANFKSWQAMSDDEIRDVLKNKSVLWRKTLEDARNV